MNKLKQRWGIETNFQLTSSLSFCANRVGIGMVVKTVALALALRKEIRLLVLPVRLLNFPIYQLLLV
jgi:hypothetical protein